MLTEPQPFHAGDHTQTRRRPGRGAPARDPGAVLVTGGAGYIGSHAVLALRDRGRPVIVIDDLSTGFREAVPPDVPLIRCRVGHKSTLQALRDYGVREVLHFAGSLIVEESVREPLKYYDNNVREAVSLLKFCLRAGVRSFVFSSTAAVYGDVRTPLVAEDLPCAPISPYGRSKLVVEQMIQDVARAHGRFGCVALRYFNVAGADPALRSGSRTANPTHLIGAALQVAAGKKPVLQVFGDDYPTADGTCERDFIHVSDLAAAHVAALEHLERNPGSSQVINCGNGRGYSVLEVIEAVRRCTGRPIETSIVDRRSGDPARVIADPARINRVFDWTPRWQDINAMVANAYAWQMSWDPPGGGERATRALQACGARTPADLQAS